jgi:hypothetical protein
MDLDPAQRESQLGSWVRARPPRGTGSARHLTGARLQTRQCKRISLSAWRASLVAKARAVCNALHRSIHLTMDCLGRTPIQLDPKLVSAVRLFFFKYCMAFYSVKVIAARDAV